MDGWGQEQSLCFVLGIFEEVARNHEGKKGQKCHQSNIQYLYVIGSPTGGQTNLHQTVWPHPKNVVFVTHLTLPSFIFISKHKSLANVGSLCIGFPYTGRLLFYSTTLILKVTRPRNLSLSSLLRRSEPSTLHSTGSSLL